MELWNPDVESLYQAERTRAYQSAVLEQWKACVETAERVSTRRATTNAFFLTVNTIVVIAVGVFWKDRPQGLQVLALTVPLAAVLVTTIVWWILLVSYRALNHAKYIVIHDLENRLPAKVFTEEWALLSIRPRRRFRQLTSLEQAVPVVFAAVYVAAFVGAVSTAGN